MEKEQLKKGKKLEIRIEALKRSLSRLTTPMHNLPFLKNGDTLYFFNASDEIFSSELNGEVEAKLMIMRAKQNFDIFITLQSKTIQEEINRLEKLLKEL